MKDNKFDLPVAYKGINVIGGLLAAAGASAFRLDEESIISAASKEKASYVNATTLTIDGGACYR